VWLVPPFTVLSHTLLQQVLCRLDGLLGATDGDYAIPGAALRLRNLNVRLGIIPNLSNPLSAWADDGARHVIRDGHLSCIVPSCGSGSASTTASSSVT